LTIPWRIKPTTLGFIELPTEQKTGHRSTNPPDLELGPEFRSLRAGFAGVGAS
jgi:hypothetical protein